MTNLDQERCVACRKDSPCVTDAEIAELKPHPVLAVKGDMKPLNLATYHLLLMSDNVWHVVMLGDILPDELRQRLTDSRATGELVSAPHDLLVVLNRYRSAQPAINA